MQNNGGLSSTRRYLRWLFDTFAPRGVPKTNRDNEGNGEEEKEDEEGFKMEYRFIIYREYEDLQTLGRALILEDDKAIYKFKTIELPLFIDSGQTNVANTNCIPEGTYKTTKIWSPSKGKCFYVHDVEGRTAILIHKGNFVVGKKVDTQGCILVGDKFSDINKDGNLDIINSTITLNKLLEILPEKFTLIIK
jgi:hypothetical protein